LSRDAGAVTLDDRALPAQVVLLPAPVLHLRSELIDAEGVRLVLTGELDIAGVDALRRAVHGVAGDGRRLVLDLRGLRFIDSTGLSMVLEAQRHVEARGGQLACLVADHGSVDRLLTMTRLCDVLDVVPVRPGDDRDRTPDAA
jgi:anti-sigma B factor antagonist